MDRKSVGALALAAVVLGLFGALLMPSGRELTLPIIAQASPSLDNQPSALILWLNPLVKTARLLQDDLQMPGELAVEVAASIHRHTRTKGISPELVVALIEIESGGDPRAVSPKEAVGLMQVHYPVWGKALGVSYDELFEVDTNIRAGVQILNHYLERYDDLTVALAAYNGNPRSRRYARKVLRAYSRLNREI